MDSIILRDLSTQARIGLDCWGRDRPQPVLITAIVSTDVTRAGLTDKVEDLTVDYSALGKAIFEHIESRGDGPGSSGFRGLHHLASELAMDVIPRLVGGEGGGDVKIIAVAPKQLLCADGLEVTVFSSPFGNLGREFNGKENSSRRTDVVSIKNFQANVVLGLNLHERLAKQRVLINISMDVHESFMQWTQSINLQFVSHILDFIENLELYTLEALVSSIALEIFKRIVELQTAQEQPSIHGMINSLTVRAEKPSGTTSGQSTGVEITRTGSWMHAHMSEQKPGRIP